jgi:hypothetical protein
MYMNIVLGVAVYLHIPSLMAVALQNMDGGIEDRALGVTISRTDLRVTADTLELKYEIRNSSKHDIWACESASIGGSGFETYLAEDGQTLMVRRRFDVRSKVVWAALPLGRYGRLGPGKDRKETLFLTLPVHWDTIFGGGGATEHPISADRLVLEIGFYEGDLFQMVLDVFGKSQAELWKRRPVPGIDTYVFPGLPFIVENEGLRDRNEQILISYMGENPKGGQSLQLVIDDQQVPYAGLRVSPPPSFAPPDLAGCTRVEIRFEPSALAYLLPYASEQGLLSSSEKAGILATPVMIASETGSIKAFANEIRRGQYIDGGIITEGSTAHIGCYRGDKQVASFTLRDDNMLEISNRQRFFYPRGLPSLRQLTPQMKQFELRVECATNLKDLWHRLRLYHKAQQIGLPEVATKLELVYPAPGAWCDDLSLAYEHTAARGPGFRPYTCPGASAGKCHYAMNPQCEPNSPADTVLLFETKDGWNQHGGPELFTFDNHDPKGGLVLLNDGTVRFIRSEEQLKQLRW